MVGQGTYRLDPQGDMVLRVHGVSRRLLVLQTNNVEPAAFARLAEELDRENGLGLDKYSGRTLQIMVSSERLAEVSTYFADLFHPLNGSPKDDYNSRLNKAMTRNPVAFIYLLGILHEKTELVPETVPFKTLVDFAVLVHCHGCYDATKKFANRWISACKLELEEDMDEDDQLACVLLSWVFRRADIFEPVTRDVIMDSEDRIRPDPLHAIPSHVINKLNQVRTERLNHLISKLHYLEDEILTGCLNPENPEHSAASNDCAFTVMNEYTRFMMAEDLILPEPKAPWFVGFSISNLMRVCGKIQVQEGFEYEFGGIHAECSFKARVRRVIEAFDTPEGLDFEKENAHVFFPEESEALEESESEEPEPEPEESLPALSEVSGLSDLSELPEFFEEYELSDISEEPGHDESSEDGY
ncbi:hypothetical protein BDV18DRAFT_157540 [Aspergillus unguis]